MAISTFVREPLTLRDGRRVLLRPIRPSDAPRLVEFHGRLSPESQYLRFFGPKPRLSRREAEYLAGVDFVRRFAIVATVREEGRERIVGVGRFDLTGEDTAEAAVAVRDDYQRQGLGTALLERLVEVARGRGVRCFSGEVLAENTRMLQLLRKNGLRIGRPQDSVVTVSVCIDQVPLVLRVLKLIAPYTAPVVDRAATLKGRRASRRPSRVHT